MQNVAERQLTGGQEKRIDKRPVESHAGIFMQRKENSRPCRNIKDGAQAMSLCNEELLQRHRSWGDDTG